MKTKILTVLVAVLATGLADAASKSIKPAFVDMLLNPYFSMQDALSKDNLADAQKGATTFQTMLGHGPSIANTPSLMDLQDQAKSIIGASDIKAARKSFLTLSNDLAAMVKEVGTSGAQDVFLMNCPMAFEGKGGDWLQNSKELTNPYYGSMMYHCGTVKGQLSKSGSVER
ncbi:MAG: DUF3347 domain-containing protein [Verrucomicrobiae bacterium]|nr:DUF3347 domain-containing protein [Verrucomicrobiae bacterium]